MKEGTSDSGEGHGKRVRDPEASDPVGSSAERATEREAKMEESGEENAA